MAEISGPGRSSASKAIQLEKAQAKQALQARDVQQNATKALMKEWADEAFNPVAMARRFKTLDEHKTRRKEKVPEGLKKGEKVAEIRKAEEAASKFQKRNPELLTKTLMILRAEIGEGDTVEDILRKVLEFYPDYSLADEALEFLEETTKSPSNENVRQARNALNAFYEREVKAGRNIGEQARAFSKEGLGSPTALRDMYRDITGNPREANNLFDELSNKFPYSKLKTVIDFLLHSLGNDLKAKGPSISRGELKRLIDDTRSLQAILGVYNFFKGRMGMIRTQFQHNGMTLPNRLNFEIIAKSFMRILAERYISAERIYQTARALGVAEEIIAQIIIFTQMRDAIRQVAPRLYRSNQHRQEALLALIEAIEELDEQMEEEGEEEEEEEDENDNEFE